MVTDNLRRRINVSKREIVTYHPRAIRNVRYEAIVRISKDLERRVVKVERFIGWLQDALLGLISAAFAVGAVVYFGGIHSWNEAIASAILSFLITTWMASFFFRNARQSRRSG